MIIEPADNGWILKWIGYGLDGEDRDYTTILEGEPYAADTMEKLCLDVVEALGFSNSKHDERSLLIKVLPREKFEEVAWIED